MRVSLVGYRASGKSTVGRLLARRLRLPFVDLDRLIEERLACPIATFFAREGEGAFRAREAEILAEALAGDGPLVLSTGGGAVLRSENRASLRARGGLVVYLEAEAEVLQARLRADAGGRPSLTGSSPADEVPAVLARRAPLYREVADQAVPATLPPEAAAERIAALLAARPGPR
jgi:shikimate kinase